MSEEPQPKSMLALPSFKLLVDVAGRGLGGQGTGGRALSASVLAAKRSEEGTLPVHTAVATR